MTLFVTLSSPLRAAEAETIDRVLAVVSGAVITQSDVNAASALGLVKQADKAEDPLGAVLSALVDRQLILIEVDRYAPAEPAAAAIEQELSNVRARFSSESTYRAVLARTGTDDKLLRQTLRDDLRIRAYLEQRFTAPPPSDEELDRYYRDHLEEFTSRTPVVPAADARAEIGRRLTAERRAGLIEDWLGTLRRRAVITNLYLPR